MKKLFAVVVAWLFISQCAFAELQILVTGGVDSKRPVAVPQFKWAGGSTLPEDVANVISSDLMRSGKFSPLKRSKCLRHPTMPRKSTIRFGPIWALKPWWWVP